MEQIWDESLRFAMMKSQMNRRKMKLCMCTSMQTYKCSNFVMIREKVYDHQENCNVITFFKIAALTLGKGTTSSSSSSIPKSSNMVRMVTLCLAMSTSTGKVSPSEDCNLMEGMIAVSMQSLLNL